MAHVSELLMQVKEIPERVKNIGHHQKSAGGGIIFQKIKLIKQAGEMNALPVIRCRQWYDKLSHLQ